MWHEILENPKPLLSIFGSKVPHLEGIRVREINIISSPSSMEITVDLSGYPDSPPNKWRSSKFNTVQVTLEMWNLRNLSISGEVSSDKGAITILKKNNDSVKMVLESSLKIECDAEIFDLKKISAYQDSIND